MYEEIHGNSCNSDSLVESKWSPIQVIWGCGF